ncbi:2-dehydropantoate 2-reductase (Ketopantoate reductase) (KPA reductase) (KPR) [Vanrija albida]|uniref:2-dehydropantoate 2-reductase n=1 Tax=Vanrija albida TaxID=181172 RepID=A0ABR3PYU0_9TREE
MRYHVLGIGSIGTLVAHNLRLAQPSADVTLVLRQVQKFVNPVLKGGEDNVKGPTLQVAQNGGDTTTTTGYEIDACSTGRLAGLAAAADKGLLSAVNAGGHIDSLIVCTKAPATSSAIAGLRSRIGPSTVIALLQNGMGVYDELCDKFWPEPAKRPHFILGTTTHGVTAGAQRGSVLHMSKPGQGAVKWGVAPDPRGKVDFEDWLWGADVGSLPALTPPPSPSLPLPPPPPGTGMENLHATLTALLSMSPLSPSLLPMPHLYNELLIKLAVNATINPLTAVLGGGYLPNGSLHRSGPATRLVRQSVQETSEILTAYVHNLAAPRTAAPDTVRLFSYSNLLHRVNSVIAATRDNKSSMAIDVQHGRMTEIDYINQFLVNLGARLKVPTPVHKMLTQMVKFKAEVAGLNKELYPVSPVRSGEEDALAVRRLGLEERRIALEERSMSLRESRRDEALAAKRAKIKLRKRVRDEEAAAATLGLTGSDSAGARSDSGGSDPSSPASPASSQGQVSSSQGEVSEAR